MEIKNKRNNDRRKRIIKWWYWNVTRYDCSGYNDAMNKIDKETENKMGKYTQGMPGLF